MLFNYVSCNYCTGNMSLAVAEAFWHIFHILTLSTHCGAKRGPEGVHKIAWSGLMEGKVSSLRASGGKNYKFGHFLVIVQLIHRLTQADITCTTTARLFFFPLLAYECNLLRVRITSVFIAIFVVQVTERFPLALNVHFGQYFRCTLILNK